MLTKTYGFDDAANYSFSGTAISIASSSARLNTEEVALSFNQTFSSTTGFTLNSTHSEITGGQLQQIDTRPANATFYANYANSIDGTWGSGVLTGSAEGGAVVSGGRLDVTGGAIKHVTYAASGNADMTNVGAIRFQYIPAFTGNPPSTYGFFSIGQALGDNNLLRAYQTSNGRIYINIRDSSGTILINDFFSSFSWLSQIYELEFNFDLTSGDIRLFIDGVQIGATKNAPGVRAAVAPSLRVGGDIRDNGMAQDAEIDQFIVFDAVQHTTNYTPNITITPTIYVADQVDLPDFTNAGVGDATGYTSLSATYSNARLVIGNKYFDGSSWTASDLSWSQSNTPTLAAANITTFPAENVLDVDVITTSSSTQGSFSDLTINYDCQHYNTGSQELEYLSTFRSERVSSFTETSTKTSPNVDITHILQLDSTKFYVSAGTWATSDGSVGQSSTASEVSSNIAKLVRKDGRNTVKVFSYLTSTSNTATPILSEVKFNYNQPTFRTSIASPTANSYISLASANTYFRFRNNSDQWINIDNSTSNTASIRLEKEALLVQATREIDKTYRFFGGKRESDLINGDNYQNLEFPRFHHTDANGDNYIPEEVQTATCEQAVWIKERTVSRKTEDGTIVQQPFIGRNTYQYLRQFVNRSVASSGRYPFDGSSF